MIQIYSADELEVKLGESIKAIRLQKNIDRQTLCNQANISMNALRHLESGQGATIKTLVRIILALNKQDWLLGIAPIVSVNPLTMVKGKAMRMRASKRRKTRE